MSHGKAHRITNEKKKLAKKKLNMKLISTNFPKFNIFNITLKEIRFSIFSKIQEKDQYSLFKKLIVWIVLIILELKIFYETQDIFFSFQIKKRITKL